MPINEVKEVQKATNFYEIQDAVAFNNPVDEKNLFYTDFTGFRKDFSEKKFFKLLNINPQTLKCNKRASPKRILLSGHRGVGKTSELLKIRNVLNDSKCYLTIFADLSDEELDVNDIDFVDILILMVEKLVLILKDKEINIKEDTVRSFYDWYGARIEEINKKVDMSASIEASTKTGFTIPFLHEMFIKTKAKLLASSETKNTIRTIFTNKFSDFSLKLNEFLNNVKREIEIMGVAQDILFIVDGFEKIGSQDDRKKILVDNSNRFEAIDVNLIMTFPIELHTSRAQLGEFASTVNFPLITLDDSSTKRFKEFIFKRVKAQLFEDGVVEQIIEYGAGSPREVLRLINEAYVQADGEIIDKNSLYASINSLGNEKVSVLTKEDLETIKLLDDKDDIPHSDALSKLLFDKVIFDYGDTKKLNPIIANNEKFKKLLANL